MNDLQKIKVMKPAFDSVHTALEVAVKDVDIWKHKDLTFMLLKTLFYVKGAMEEMDRLVKLEDAGSRPTGDACENRRADPGITSSGGPDIN